MARGARLAIGLFLVAATSLPLCGAQAGGKASPAEIAARQRQVLDDMLTDQYQPALIANLRRSCESGQEPASIAESRAQGAYFTPDAADICVTALVRTAHDGRLLDLYRELLTKMGGDAEAFARWPRVVGDTVLSGKTAAASGNHKAAEVTPALAFDAGFTVAYQEGGTNKDAALDAAQLKALAGSCLSQRQDAGTCYSIGYMYGIQAFAARTAQHAN